MKASEVKALRDEELKVELDRLRTRLYDLRSQAVTEKVEDTSQFGQVRRDVARILTERNARRRGAAPAVAATAVAVKPAKAAKPAPKKAAPKAAKPAASQTKTKSPAKSKTKKDTSNA